LVHISGFLGSGEREMSKSMARLGFKTQVAVVLCFYVGLFFVEYPPLFIVGYWSWGALVHKSITGVLLAVNLVITQYAAKRLGLFRGSRGVDREATQLAAK
jgi:hypothetical protein